MDAHLLQRADERGYVTRPEILDSGYLDRDIRDAIKLGLLTRIGPGLYALTASYTPLDAAARHAVRSRAVFHRHRGNVVLTHQSAAAIHGLPVWDLSLDEVQVTRLDGRRGRHEANVSHHIGAIDESQIVQVGDVLVSSPDRCVWEVACSGSTESGIVTADAALHRALVSEESLNEVKGTFASWQGSRSARLALTLADGLSESPGESRSRHLFWRHGLPTPDLQMRIVDAGGRTIARTNFGWQLYRHLAEFDGRIKYDGTFGPEGFETVFTEKRREDLVRAEMWGLSRLIWSDLDAKVESRTAARLQADLERSRSVYGRFIVA